MKIVYQILTDNKISIVIFVFFFLIQLILFLYARRKIKKVSKIFPDGDHTVIDNDTNKPQIASVNGHEVYNDILNKINMYTSENSDSIDFNEMKDIANRISDKELQAATSNTASPMYIGLMGTYIGVAFGLFQLVYSMANDSGKMFDSNAVYIFIGGVIVAMMTSFFGLVFTTINNSFASEVTKILQGQRDRFYIFLQSKILPVLPSTLAQTLKEELQRSIGALGNTIGMLDATVRTLNTDLKSTFEGITSEFGEKLTFSLSTIQEVVSSLTTSATSYVESMKKQDEILTKMNSPAFTSVLNKISKTVDSCAVISGTIERIEETANDILVKQEKSGELQTSLIVAQNALFTTQNAASENIIKLEEKLSEDTVRLHEQLNKISVDAQQRLNTLMDEPSKLFGYIQSTLKQFTQIEQFVESVTNQEFANHDARIEYINSQLRTLERAGDTIKNYMATTKTELKDYLDEQRGDIKRAGVDFVTSWNRMFSEMSANGAENPLVYLRQLMGLEQTLEKIQQSLDVTKVDQRVLDELNSIQSLLNEIKSITSIQRTTTKKIDGLPPKPLPKKRFFNRFISSITKKNK